MVGTSEVDEQVQKCAMDLFVTYHCSGNYFSSALFLLIGKADGLNKDRLFIAYPMEVTLWIEWTETTPEWRFYEKYKVGEVIGKPDKEVYDHYMTRNKDEEG